MSSLVQQTDEWLEMRKSHVGASDAPVIMGVSPWKTPYQLWEEKLGFRKNNTTSAMRRGLDMEEQARQEFEKKTGIIVFPEVVFSHDRPWMMASLDGIDIERKNIVEIKCPGRIDHEMAMDGIVPEKYYPQIQHQICVTGLDSAHYFSYDGNSSIVINVDRDKKYIDSMLLKEEIFWQCMTQMEAPDLTERDYVDIQDDIWIETASRWKAVNQQMEELREQESDLRKSLICMCGKSNSRGGGIRLSRVVRKGAVDYKSISELEGVDLEKYRKSPVETWRISRG